MTGQGGSNTGGERAPKRASRQEEGARNERRIIHVDMDAFFAQV